MNDQKELITDVKQIIAKVARIDSNTINNNSSLRNDLWLDSLQAIQIVAQIEEQFKIQIDEVEIFNIDNLEEIAALIQEYQNQ